MTAKETIQSLFEVVNELKQNDEFKRKDFYELIDLSIKIIDLSLKDEINCNLQSLDEINCSLNEIQNNLVEINKTLIYNMLQPEEMAIDLFNKALKLAIHLPIEMKKEEAKEIVLNNILVIKEALYNCTLIENQHIRIGKTIDYYNKVKDTIEKL